MGLCEWEKKNDLCLVMGTSLSGFNADRVADTAVEQGRLGKSAGLVIINLQETPYDEFSSLRIYATIDAVMEMLAEALGISDMVKSMEHVHKPSLAPQSQIQEDLFLVPFDAHGNPSEEKTIWDLREGSRVRLTGGPYAGDVGKIMGKNDDGHYRIRFEDSLHPIFKVKYRPFSLWLGNWWLEEASRGYAISPGGKLPFVNVANDDV